MRISRRVAVLAGLTALQTLLATAVAGAAPDHSARLSLDEPRFEWAGGPGTGVSVPTTNRHLPCGVPVGYDCDDVLLDIAERGSLAIALHGPEQQVITDPTGVPIATMPDLDVYLYRSDAQGQRTSGPLTGDCASPAASESCLVEALEPGLYLLQVEYFMAHDTSYTANVELVPAPPAPVPLPDQEAKSVEWKGTVTGDGVMELAVRVDEPATCDLLAQGAADGTRAGTFAVFVRIDPDTPAQYASLGWGGAGGVSATVGTINTDPMTFAARGGFGARFQATATWTPGVHRLLLIGRGLKQNGDSSMWLAVDCDVALRDVRWAGSRELLLLEPESSDSANASVTAGGAGAISGSSVEKVFHSPRVTGILYHSDPGTATFRLFADGPGERKTWQTAIGTPTPAKTEILELQPGHWRAGFDHYAGAAYVKLLLTGLSPLEHPSVLEDPKEAR